MALVTGCWTYDFLLLIGSVFLAGYLKFRLFTKNYWKKRNIPCEEPYFLLGNTPEVNITKNTLEKINELYMRNKKHKLFGIWLYTKPILLVQDLQIVKNILVKDFQNFHDRGISVNEELDPLNAHLFNMSGVQWRNLRVKLTPTFTSGKMKMMYPTMAACAKELQDFLEAPAGKKEVVEVKDVLARFTTDIISSCAFGIETNSLKNPDSEFRKYGKKIFRPGFFNIIVGLLKFLFPNLDKLIPLKQAEEEVENFFLDTVRETIEYREKNNVKRKDFMDLIIQLRSKGYVEDADHKYDKNSEVVGDKFTFEQAAAQAFVFFAAGFETSSTAMMFALYELAKNPDVQKKVQLEIDSVLRKHGSDVPYEVINDMQYLDGVVNESLRMYPPVGALFRECTKEYKIPELGVTIEKGTSVNIPIAGIQNDPDYFPNPEQFRPERFFPEEKAQRDHFLHLPFGEGPRICIGNRFGLLQSKTGLFHILSKYEVSVAETTPIPLNLDPLSFIPSPKNGMPLRISKRKIEF